MAENAGALPEAAPLFSRRDAGQGRRGHAVHPVLVYGGKERRLRTGATVLPWSAVGAFDWTGRLRALAPQCAAGAAPGAGSVWIAEP